MPLPRRTRSHSHSAEFPPPSRRRSSKAERPIPFSAKFQKVHPGTTGVTVLEHLERLDAVEAGLQRLGVEESKRTKRRSTLERRPHRNRSLSPLIRPRSMIRLYNSLPHLVARAAGLLLFQRTHSLVLSRRRIWQSCRSQCLTLSHHSHLSTIGGTVMPSGHINNLTGTLTG